MTEEIDTWDELWETMPVVVYGLRGGTSTHVDWLNKVKAEGDRLQEKAVKYDLVSNNYFEVSNDGTTWNTTNLSKVLEAIEKLEAVKTHILSLRVSTSQWWRDLVRKLWDESEAEKILEGEI